MFLNNIASSGAWPRLVEATGDFWGGSGFFGVSLKGQVWHNHVGNTEASPITLLNLSAPRGIPPHEFHLGAHLSTAALRKAGHPINSPSCLSAEKTGNDINAQQPEPGAFQAVSSSCELLLLKYRLCVPAVKFSGTCCARTRRADLHTELLLVSWKLSWISGFSHILRCVLENQKDSKC